MKDAVFRVDGLTVEAHQDQGERCAMVWSGSFLGREPEGLGSYIEAVTQGPAGHALPHLEFDFRAVERISSGMMGWVIGLLFASRSGRESISLRVHRDNAFQRVFCELLQQVVRECENSPGARIALQGEV